MGSFRVEVAGEAGTVPCPGFGLTQPKSQMALEIGADSTAKWEKIAKIPNLGSIILGSGLARFDLVKTLVRFGSHERQSQTLQRRCTSEHETYWLGSGSAMLNDLVAKIDDYLDGNASLQQFKEWFFHFSFDLDRKFSGSVVDLVHEIEGILAEAVIWTLEHCRVGSCTRFCRISIPISSRHCRSSR